MHASRARKNTSHRTTILLLRIVVTVLLLAILFASFAAATVTARHAQSNSAFQCLYACCMRQISVGYSGRFRRVQDTATCAKTAGRAIRPKKEVQAGESEPLIYLDLLLFR